VGSDSTDTPVTTKIRHRGSARDRNEFVHGAKKNQVRFPGEKSKTISPDLFFKFCVGAPELKKNRSGGNSGCQVSDPKFSPDRDLENFETRLAKKLGLCWLRRTLACGIETSGGSEIYAPVQCTFPVSVVYHVLGPKKTLKNNSVGE